MKKIIQITIVFIVFGIMTGGIYAQNIELKGAVRDAASNGALVSVNIVLQTQDSAFVTGTTSDDKGKFVIPNVNPGDYRLAMSYIGYITQYIELEGLNTGVTLPDILMEEDVIGLEDVTVTASATTSRIDRKLVFPTEQQINASSNGVDLLQQLMLPRLQVNALTRDISAIGGGDVQLRINGVKVDVNDIVALQPKDIIRVEYHDNPGLRYGNAAAVIDYIIRRHESGGNLGVDIMNSINLNKYGKNGIYGRINRKNSEFAVNYHFNHLEFNQMWRENEETFHFADGSTLRRRETGEPGHIQEIWQDLNAAYSYLNERRMFNATFRYFSDNEPDKNYNGKLYNMANPDDYLQMIDREKLLLYRPAFDLYYQENLKNDQTLIVNLVGTYNYIENGRIYRESREGVLLTDVDNNVTGNKYSWIGESIYEKKFGNNSLGAGLRHTQSYSDNTYRNSQSVHTRMQQSETSLYGEWKGKTRKLDYTLGAGVVRSGFRQERGGRKYDYYMFNPLLALFLPLPGNSSVRLTARINNNIPSLSELSAVEQNIDSLQVQRGNPGLNPYLSYQSILNYEWHRGIFHVNLLGHYEYQPSAVMDEKFLEGDQIVQTWDNQKNRQFLISVLSLRVGPIRDILTVACNGAFNHTVSNGNTYRHVFNDPFLNVTVSGNYKNFQTQFFWTSIWKELRGETITGSENFHTFSLDYKYRDMNFGIGIYNLLGNSLRQDTENRSAYASYRRSSHTDDFARMFLFRYSWNISFGRSFQSGRKRLNNADNDAGVMNAGK
jgi:hypothetical protein